MAAVLAAAKVRVSQGIAYHNGYRIYTLNGLAYVHGVRVRVRA